MANVVFNLLLADSGSYTGSVYIRPRGVQLSGSGIITLDPVADHTNPFVFENITAGLYECTASNQTIESPLWLILVPTGSDTWNAADLEFPPTSRSLHWTPERAVSSSWADFAGTASFVRVARTASYVQGSNVKGLVDSASYALKATDADTLGGYSPSFFQTASNLTSGYVLPGRLSGSYTITASVAVSSSYAVSASSVPASGVSGTVRSASFATSASWAPDLYPVQSGSSLNITASWAANSISASWAPIPISASWASRSLSASVAARAGDADTLGGLSGSYFTDATNLRNYVLPSRLSGSYEITSSVALRALTASYVSASSIDGVVRSSSYSDRALTASYALNVPPPQTVVSTSFASASLSASYATSASWAPDLYPVQSGSSLNITASWALNAKTASFVSASGIVGTVESASYALSASWAPFPTFPSNITASVSASWASSSLSASYVPNLYPLVSGSVYNITASWANFSLTASAITFVPRAALSASWASSSISSSYALSGSFASTLGDNPQFIWRTSGNGPDLRLVYDPTPIGGGLIFRDSNGVEYLGISTDGNPVRVYTHLTVDGDLRVGGTAYLTASHAVSSSFAVQALSASLADTASYARFSTSASYITASGIDGVVASASVALSASYSLSSSFAIRALTASYVFNSVSGAFCDTSSFAISASYAVTSSHSERSNYALSASTLIGLEYSSGSYTLDYSGSNLIVTQRVTGSFNSVEFSYTAVSGSALSKGRIEAAWINGDSSSLIWNNIGTLDRNDVDLEMNMVMGGNSVQLRAYAPLYAGWFIRWWALWF